MKNYIPYRERSKYDASQVSHTFAARESGSVVRNSGPGLDPKGLDRLFDAFYTTKPEGLGMGLAVSRSITEAHGGRLRAKANVPQGTVFQFTLPFDEEGMS